MKTRPKVLMVEYMAGALKKEFEAAADKAGLDIEFARFENILVDTSKSDPTDILTVNGKKITEYDLIYVRTINKRYYEMAILATYASQHGVRVVDKCLSTGNRITDAKIYQILHAALHDVRVPRTVYGTDTALADKADLFGGFPLVFKVMGLHRGQGVFLVNSKGEIRKLMDQFMETHESKNFILQEVIDYVADYRIFVVGDQVLGAIQRIPSKGEFRANVSRGGSAKAIKDLNPSLEKMALDSAKAMGLDIAGVDFLEDKDGNYFLLEINRAPQYKGFVAATGIDVRGEVFRYFKKLIDAKS